MALFDNFSTSPQKGTRSNTKLVVSGGFSPAEHFIVDPSLQHRFTYTYGGAGQTSVVVPKGFAVGILPEPQIDYESGKTKSVLTIAGKNGAKCVGIAPYNYTKHNEDQLDGNQPAIITREFIELPFGTDKAKIGELQFGAVDANGLKNGDFVTYCVEADGPEMLGKLKKAGTNDPIVGQVLGMEADAQIQGWLKWALWDEAAKSEDWRSSKATGYEVPHRGGYPYDADYAEGNQDIDGYLNQYTTNPTGVPGLLDGKLRTETVRQQTIKVSKGKKAYEMKDQDIKEADLDGFDAVGSLSELAVGKFYLDAKEGILHIQAADSAADRDVLVTYKAFAYGTPAHLDFDGVLGACRILLRF